MNIYGKKIILRAIELSDADMLLELINDSETENNLGGSSFPISMDLQKKWIENQNQNDEILRCIIADQENLKRGLGTVILSDIDRHNGVAEIHIKLAKESRGKGIGTDAINATVGYAFDSLRLNCIVASVLCYNERSQKLFETCGFVIEGILRQRVYKNGQFIDMFSYSILKEDYDKNK